MRRGELEGSEPTLAESDQPGGRAVPLERELDIALRGLGGSRIDPRRTLGETEKDAGYERGLCLSGS